MSIKNMFASLMLLTVVGTAFAEAPYSADSKFVSTKTRAELIAELQQAREHGLISHWRQLSRHRGSEIYIDPSAGAGRVEGGEQSSNNLSYADLVFLR